MDLSRTGMCLSGKTVEGRDKKRGKTARAAHENGNPALTKRHQQGHKNDMAYWGNSRDGGDKSDRVHGSGVKWTAPPAGAEGAGGGNSRT